MPVLGMQFAVSTPVQAAAPMFMQLPVASVMEIPADIPGLEAPAPRPVVWQVECTRAPTGAALFAQSKASAVLGGAPSKLELISQQQTAGIGQSGPVRIGAKIQPAAGSVRCQQFTVRRSTPAAVVPFPRPVTNPGDFLASARLPLRRTNFDAQWNRVRFSRLHSRDLSGLNRPWQAKPTKATLAAVNAWANTRIRYEEDRDIFGKADYWATASATIRRGAGDCEDIAIVKMQGLAALGVPRSDMFLTIARDTIRRADHALLVVKLDGRYWLLDNATNTVLDATMSYGYRPIMSFSSSGKWLHGYNSAEGTATTRTTLAFAEAPSAP